MTKRCERFRQLLESPQLEFLCEAHNGISARIVEEAGFAGVWASGLSIAAQFGVRDNNEASWTQVLEVLEFMADSTELPILVDGDTGYGNFNNVMRLVRKLEQRGIAAVCLEDKQFPKTNSFINGTAQELADIDEFCGKIKAAKDAQSDPDFSVIARVEAFVVGAGLDEAMRRASAYHEAGADAILIHSARSDAGEVLLFKEKWGDRSPVVIVPTRYYSTPTEVFREYGFSTIIWANHIMRASVQAMQQTAERLFREQSLINIEDAVAPIKEIFRLQKADALQEAEARYLPSGRNMPAAIVLAASRGEELGELTEDRPKAMVEICGEPLLQVLAEAFRSIGIRDISVVRGYCKHTLDLPGLRYVDNDQWSDSGELVSLAAALAQASDGQDHIVAYGDVIFSRFVPEVLSHTDGRFVVLVDDQWRDSANRNRQADYVRCSEANSVFGYMREIWLQTIADELPEEQTHGEWMGFLKVSREALPVLRDTLQELLADAANRQAKMPLLINRLIANGERVRVLYTSGHWLDIDSVADVVEASRFYRGGA